MFPADRADQAQIAQIVSSFWTDSQLTAQSSQLCESNNKKLNSHDILSITDMTE
jgi:hypothetical protein